GRAARTIWRATESVISRPPHRCCERDVSAGFPRTIAQKERSGVQCAGHIDTPMENMRHPHLGSDIASCASALLPCSSAPAYAQCNVALVHGACLAALWVLERQSWP